MHEYCACIGKGFGVRLNVNLGCLRGFDAAARSLSFTLAAKELGVTQGAVSRQVAMLEQDLGVQLFNRLTRRIELTTAGRDFHEAVRTSLYVLERGVQSLRSAAPDESLKVSVLPTVGAVWLMPRLHKFVRANGGVDVRIVTSIEAADFSNGDLDVAIRVGSPPGSDLPARAPRIDIEMVNDWAGVESRPLFRDALVPVVSARVWRQALDRTPTAILSSMPLIHVSSRRYGWPDWLAAQGISLSDQGGPEFGHFFMALDEARAGRGVALVPDIVLRDMDGRRQLQVLPFPIIESAGSYHALVRRDQAKKPKVARFLAWLETEAAELKARAQASDAPALSTSTGDAQY